MVGRTAAGGALVLAVLLVALIVFAGGSSYQARLLFSDASGLVAGDQVMIGPANVGSVQSISLTGNGQAAVVIGLDGDAAPLYRGTVARIAENGLAGIASHYVTLQPAPSSRPTIPSGGTITQSHTYAEVSLDQLFDTFDPLTRAGLRNLIRGQATAIRGKALQANRTLVYLAPALASTSQVTGELSRSEPAFDQLLVQGAQTMQALASRSEQLTELVTNTERTTGAIAQQSAALSTALGLLPATLTKSTATFAGLRSTLDALDPVVNAAKPAVRRLPEFLAELRTFTEAAIPTVDALTTLIHNPAGTGDLTELFQEAPALASAAASAFPHVIRALNDSQSQLDYLREYTPDVVAALTNLGQASGYYDANGHYMRTQPFFGAFGLDAGNELTDQPPASRYNGLQVVRRRCPGSAVQPPPDGSAPVPVPGCDTSSTPPGP